eukprot:2864162-Amphidinium_carterae.1
MTPKTFRTICKELCPLALGEVIDIWVPNTFQGTGTCLVRVAKDSMHKFMQLCTDTGFSVMQMKAIEGTQVVWLKEKALGDAQNQAQA